MTALSDGLQKQITFVTLMIFCVTFQLLEEGYQYVENPNISRLWLDVCDLELIRIIMILLNYILSFVWISITVYALQDETNDGLHILALSHLAFKTTFYVLGHRTIKSAAGTKCRKATITMMLVFWISSILSAIFSMLSAMFSMPNHDIKFIGVMSYSVYNTLNVTYTTMWLFLVVMYIYGQNNKHKYDVVFETFDSENTVDTTELSLPQSHLIN